MKTNSKFLILISHSLERLFARANLQNSKLTMTTQDRFTLALNATWSVLHDPVLTKIYSRQWKRYVTQASKILTPGEKLLTLYGFIFNVMYREL